MKNGSVPKPREAKRTPARIPTTLIVEVSGSKTKHDATIVDISPEGVQVEVGFPLVLGDSVRVELDQHRTNSRRGRVVWVESLWPRRHWRAGIKLLDRIHH